MRAEGTAGSYRIGTDVGGTFTDFILVRPDGEIVLSKVPTIWTIHPWA